MPKLGEYLRESRQRAGLATRQVARRADCSEASVNRLERGERSVSLELLWRLVRALDGDYPHAVALLAEDHGVPPEVLRDLPAGLRAAAPATSEIGEGKPPNGDI